METRLKLLKYNPHWQGSFTYPYSKTRQVFEQLKRALLRRQIIEIVGLRRTGKTVLLFQIINCLLSRQINPFSIWYFTFDEEKASLDDLFQLFSVQTQIDFKKEKVYIFLDEIQKLPDFQNQLKVYYDIYPNLKFFISGSTSLFLRKRTQESLAGRIIEFYLLPLNFREYLHFKEKDEILERPLLFEGEIEKEFDIFLESQFIESILLKKADERREYFVSIIKKIVFEDIPQIFPVEHPEVLWQIVKIIGQKPGILIDYQNLSKNIGISNKTISSYLFYLEESFLVKKVYNFSRNLLTSEKKLKKFYLASPSLSWALTDFIEKGRLAENLLPSLRNYKFFWRDAYKHEIDFIDVEDGEIIPTEVKYRKEIDKRDFKNLIIFARRFEVEKSVIFGKNITLQAKNIGDIKIDQLPIYFV